MSLSANTRLGRYEIRSQLGAGGMGEVYLTEDITLHRRAAVKVLTSDFTQNEERLHRFVREAYAASSLNHPNIVTIYEIGSEAHIHFIATEYVDGESLRDHLRFKQMELREILDVAIQVTSALAAAHEAGIIHRDIKPENIMLRRDGYVKVLDFGLAKLMDESDSTQKTDPEAPTEVLLKTEPGRVMGTINYMSPEQARGRDVDSRSDIFSVGVMLYEMVAGHRPFSGDTKSDVLAAVLMLEQKPLAEKFPGMPPELNRIVNKALRKDREERYQTAKELLVDLKSLRQDLEFEAKMGREIWRAPQAEPAAQTDDLVKRSTGEKDAPRTISELFVNEVRIHPRRATVTLAVVLAALLAGGAGVVQLIKSVRKPESFQSMRLSKLTLAGNIEEWQTAISPDGKYVVYVVKEGDEQSLWVRQVASSRDLQIIQPEDVRYRGLAFSPDGNYVFYVSNDGRLQVLYQIPTLGGPPRKIVENIEGPVTFSPDGQRLAFVDAASFAQLMIANVDGTHARSLASGSGGETFTMPSWSPNGEAIAVGVLSPADATRRLVEVSVKDGTKKPLASQRWLSLIGLGWLPDGTGLLITARDFDTRLLQIWLVSYPEGNTRRVTNDLSSYTGLSLTADGKILASVQGESLSNIWVVPEGKSNEARRLTFETGRDEGRSGIAITPDDKIVYSARSTGIWDLWMVDQDGKNNRQLTHNTRGNYFPSVTPDGRYIVFVSLRSGTTGIWRMILDGSNPEQLVSGPGIVNAPLCSPDGRWVVYEQTGDDHKTTIWKVDIDGGQPIRLTDEFAVKPSISPDGKFIVCRYGKKESEASRKLALISIDGGEPLKIFDWPVVTRSSVIRWSADGRGLIYVDSRDRVYNLWTQPLDGGLPKAVTDFSSDQIFGFDMSRDGKIFALARGREGSDVVLISNFK